VVKYSIFGVKTDIKLIGEQEKLQEKIDKYLIHMELTEREREVFLLRFEGKTNNDIAKKLNIGYSTVKTHVSNILKKTHAEDFDDLIDKLSQL
jgi:RNA polymerase sigma factor (sigma-70 family)